MKKHYIALYYANAYLDYTLLNKFHPLMQMYIDFRKLEQ